MYTLNFLSLAVLSAIILSFALVSGRNPSSRFFFFGPPVVCGSSWSRDQIRAAAVTYATVVATGDP